MTTKYRAFILSLVLLALTSGCWIIRSDTYDTTKYTAAHQAALDGDNQTLSGLLKENPSLVNVSDYDKNSLLHLAVMHNRTNTVTLLLDDKANVNAMNSVGMTPLHFAAREGFLEVTQLLIEHNANLQIIDRRGWTALKWAEMSHHDDVAALLRTGKVK